MPHVFCFWKYYKSIVKITFTLKSITYVVDIYDSLKMQNNSQKFITTHIVTVLKIIC